MGYERHYKAEAGTPEYEAEDQQAIRDLEEWFSPEQVTLIHGWLSSCTTYAMLDQINIAIGMGGVEGRPVLALFRSYFGADAVEEWRSGSKWDPDTLIKGVSVQ